MNLLHLPCRLAFIFALQVVACIYATLVVRAMVKVRNTVGAEHFRPISAFSILIKDFGWLLWLLPAWWFFYHVRKWQRDGADFALLGKLVVTGAAVFGVIALLAFLGSLGAMTRPILPIE